MASSCGNFGKPFNKIALLSFLTLALCTAPSLWAQERMQAGLWEVTQTIDKDYTGKQCFTPAEVKGINGDTQTVREYAQKKAAAQPGCTATDVKLGGSTISYNIVCPSRAAVTVKITYHGDSFEGEMSSNGTVNAKMKGRRLGAVCP